MLVTIENRLMISQMIAHAKFTMLYTSQEGELIKPYCLIALALFRRKLTVWAVMPITGRSSISALKAVNALPNTVNVIYRKQ